MSQSVKKYPYDKAGNLPSNHIVEEYHTVTLNGDRLVVPKAGAIFDRDVRVMTSPGGRELVRGTDYILNCTIPDITLRTGLGAYGLIVIKNPDIAGELLVDYRCVGGEYQKYNNAIIEAMRAGEGIESVVYWKSIRGLPERFTPEIHQHNAATDLFGLDSLVAGVQEIARSVAGYHPDVLLNLKKVVSEKVSNLTSIRRGFHGGSWELSKTNNLRISLRPAGGPVTFEFYCWDELHGESKVIVTGLLDENGIWRQTDFRTTRGHLSAAEFAFVNIDGTTVELLVRSTSAHITKMRLDKVIIFDNVEQLADVQFRPLNTLPIPIPQTFNVPKPVWYSGGV